MIENTKLIALSVLGAALLAFPAIASANPAHTDSTGSFTVAGSTATVLETTTGEKITCQNGVTGNGTFESTTTGNFSLRFHNCTTVVFGFNVACTTSGQPSGTIEAAKLPFHMIMFASNSPGVLVTPWTAFAHFACAGVNKTVTGNGVIGTITSPKCGTLTNTATLSFEMGEGTGLQKHTTYTGFTYHLDSGGLKTALISAATMKAEFPKTLICT